MGKSKEVKTNAMRILERNKIPYKEYTYECDEFISGTDIADRLGQNYDESFKTLVAVGKSSNYFVFVIPIDKELDLKKAAKVVGEKNVEMLHVMDINKVTGYVRGGCTPIGMKKQYKTVLHNSIMNYDKVIISGGRIGTQLVLAPEDIVKVTSAIIEDICM